MKEIARENRDLLDNFVTELIENLKPIVFKDDLLFCFDLIDVEMAILVDVGFPVGMVIDARSKAFGMFERFCSENLGMIAFASAFRSLKSQKADQSECDSEHNNRSGYLYAAKITDGMVKIGRSKDPQKRLLYMQYNGRLAFSETFISDLFQDYIEVEAQLHSQFAVKKRTGEWFDITFDEAVAAIKELAKTLVPAPLKQLENRDANLPM